VIFLRGTLTFTKKCGKRKINNTIPRKKRQKLITYPETQKIFLLHFLLFCNTIVIQRMEVKLMAKESVLQVRMDAETKEQAEQLYKKLGTTFAEGVRMFAKQSIAENAMPFVLHLTNQNMGMRIGAAKGEFTVPEDIDGCNGEIETLFGGGE
jgi:DNA-damage-inducible protein J